MELAPNITNKLPNSYRRTENIGPVDAAEGDSKLRRQAHINGYALFKEWVSKRQTDINAILALADNEGKLPLRATCFNDLYKWTMLPVIRKMEELKGPITVTFGVDLRDPEMRAELNSSTELQGDILAALQSLKTRPFDRTLFEAVLANKNLKPIVTDDTIESICGPVGSPRMLVDGEVYTAEGLRTASDENLVTISFYKKVGAKYSNANTSDGLQIIEATGPWHKVTWLETSLMQCVYEAKLRYDLRKKAITYNEWLYRALLRCAKSIAYTHLIQDSVAPTFLPALFSGRRTGGFIFILLQNFLFADHFVHLSKEGSHKALGTASCDAWFELGNKKIPCLPPVGTNAHELRMVAATLFPQLDVNSELIPYSQVLVDYMYQTIVLPQTKGFMPMLPDTLGTRAYLKAASCVMMNGAPYLKNITMARQDSGNLSDFKANMADAGFAGKTMASEIDTTASLLEAATEKYDYFGAGGFFGDSEKVWGNPETPSNSMAVKAVRVVYTGPTGIEHPLITYKDGKIVGYPVKIGDPGSRLNPSLTKGKLSLDKTLDPGMIKQIRDYAEAVRVNAGKTGPFTCTSPMTLEELLTLAGIPSSNSSSSSRRRRSKRRRTTRRRRL